MVKLYVTVAKWVSVIIVWYFGGSENKGNHDYMVRRDIKEALHHDSGGGNLVVMTKWVCKGSNDSVVLMVAIQHQGGERHYGCGNRINGDMALIATVGELTSEAVTMVLVSCS